ncbi:MAG: hypothetical protein EOM20_12355, partial [Spartobacteria bacterium]|nr:hypothetical protein [Spartobacteria bacterium]
MRLEKWIITGMAVCLAALSAGAPGRDELSLPLALFEDGDWAGVRRECRRVLARNPTDYDALLLDSMAAIQAGDSSSNVTHALLKVFTQATNAPLRTTAAYELGRAYWRQDRPDEAYTYIKYAFQHAEDHAMLLHSACSLELLREEYGSRLPDDREIQMQLHTLRGLLWPKALREECRITRGPPRLSVLSLPGAWVTRFYRTQIRPAIGDRCELHPSCS